MTWIPTSECHIYPPNSGMRNVRLPLSNMTDEEIDVHLWKMIDAGAHPNTVPRSQYWRRCAVREWLYGKAKAEV